MLKNIIFTRMILPALFRIVLYVKKSIPNFFIFTHLFKISLQLNASYIYDIVCFIVCVFLFILYSHIKNLYIRMLLVSYIILSFLFVYLLHFYCHTDNNYIYIYFLCNVLGGYHVSDFKSFNDGILLK